MYIPEAHVASGIFYRDAPAGKPAPDPCAKFRLYRPMRYTAAEPGRKPEQSADQGSLPKDSKAILVIHAGGMTTINICMTEGHD